MTDGIARRRFLTQLTFALTVGATGGSLVWWASASAEPPQRKTPSGDLLETVPRGELRPLSARVGQRWKRSTAMRWSTERFSNTSRASAAAERSGTGTTPIAMRPNGSRMGPSPLPTTGQDETSA